MSYSVKLRKEGRKVIDVKYQLRAAMDFVGEQKAANKRGNESHIQALKAGLPIGR